MPYAATATQSMQNANCSKSLIIVQVIVYTTGILNNTTTKPREAGIMNYQQMWEQLKAHIALAETLQGTRTVSLVDIYRLIMEIESRQGKECKV